MTIEEFKNKLEQDKALKAEMLEAIKAGKEEEFLAAQGVEVPEKKELSDDELTGAAGGLTTEGYLISDSVYKTDSRGNPTHWLNTYQTGKKTIGYYTCPNCGRVLHKGTFGLNYCDPCDEWFSSGWGSDAVWHEDPYNG